MWKVVLFSFRRICRDTGNTDGNSYWSISMKNICFWEKHTRLLKHFRWQRHKFEREMCPSTISVNRFIFLLSFLPISKPELQRVSIHPTMSPRGAVQSPHTKAPGNQTRYKGVVQWHSPPASGLGGLRPTRMKRETSEEIRRSEVTQTEPDKVTAEVTRFASSRSYMQRFIYILRGSFKGVQSVSTSVSQSRFAQSFHRLCLICLFQLFESDFYIQISPDVLNAGPSVVLMIRSFELNVVRFSCLPC